VKREAREQQQFDGAEYENHSCDVGRLSGHSARFGVTARRWSFERKREVQMVANRCLGYEERAHNEEEQT
jgi:hypothetical protein